MNLKLDVPVMSPEGKPFEKTLEDKSPVMARTLCMKGVLDCKSSHEAAPSIKYDRGVLAEKIINSTDETDYKVEEVATIKNSVGEFYDPWVVMKVWNILEGK